MLNEKIKQILVEKNLSPSHFADEIGVQRSSISHILAGRNKPSFDIIQKIIKRFPDLGYEWLMDENTGLAGLGVNDIPSNTKRSKNGAITNGSALNGKHSESHKKKLSEPTPVQPILEITENSKVNLSSEKKVERILIFYSDKTFTEYKPY